MPRDGEERQDDVLSESDSVVERVIASLKWLTEACRRGGLGIYADILDDALSLCLQHYVAEQREKLAQNLEADRNLPGKVLN